ncbi:MAG: S1 RNA-binding domain-containing protein, partial [archaeon]|nr:S1 RNA-binding domain-containing protein [archaeon]
LGLLRPDRDPRDDLPQPILKSDILHMEDLEPGMVLKGTVRNVVDFGAFVDIGLHDDGLVHISEMKRLDGNNGYISDPTEVIRVGDIIDVRIVEVDIKKHRIQLSMRLDAEEDPTSDRNRQSRQSSRVGEPSFGNITIRQKKKKN